MDERQIRRLMKNKPGEYTETVAAVPGTDTLEEVRDVYAEKAVSAIENIFPNAVQSEDPFIENGALIHNVRILDENLTMNLQPLNEDAILSVYNVGRKFESEKNISSSRNGVQEAVRMIVEIMNKVIDDRMREETL